MRPSTKSLSSSPSGTSPRDDNHSQSQQSRNNSGSSSGRSSCSTKVWLERLLFMTIGALASVGMLYSHRIATLHPYFDNDEIAILPQQQIRSKTSSSASSSMEGQQQQQQQQQQQRQLDKEGKNRTSEIDEVKALRKKEESTVPQQQEQEQQQSTVQQQQEQEQQQQQEKATDGTVQSDGPEKDSNNNAEEEGKTDSDTKTTTTPNPKDRLNVVLFYADDWTQKVLGKLNPDVHTPNIDEMADNGMLFTNNCVTTSVCWISRATLVSGVYLSRHRQKDPSAMGLFTTHPWSETLFPLLKKAGYYTGLIGKWHAPQPEDSMKEAFDVQNFYYGEHHLNYGGTIRHVTDLNREHAIGFLQNRPRDQNFALKVSFYATHALDYHYPSYEPMNKTREQFYPNNITIDEPKTATNQHWEDLPPFFTEHNEGRQRWKKRFEPDYYQDNIKDIYSMATEVDWAVGEIIKVLKEQGVYDNTYMIFTTDNGNLHGEHGLVEKWYPFEESIRVPLVIQDPRMPKEKRGTRNGDWTLNIDLAPSLLGAANIPQSYFMQGKDIASLYLPKDMMLDQAMAAEPWRKDWFYEYHMGDDPITAMDHTGKGWIDASFALVTDEWKYIQWPQQEYEQLFHRSLDPYDEWDLLDQRKNHTNIQTTLEVYEKMKSRFAVLKELAQSGHRV